MINRIRNEYSRLTRRLAELAAPGSLPPLGAEKVDKLYNEIDRLMDRVKTCRDLQKKLLGVLQIVSGIDWIIPKDMPQQSSEILALKKLCEHTGASKVRRVADNEIIRPSRLDCRYNGHPGRRNGLFFLSSSPAPAVYFLTLDAIGIDVRPVYEPFQRSEDVKK